MTRVAIYQSRTGIDPAASAKSVGEAVAAAAADGAGMLFTPEMSNIVDSDRERAFATAAPENEDVVLAAAREAATKHGIWIHLGSIAVRAEGDAQCLANRAFVIDKNGAIAARYDKIHLFDVDLPTGESWRESAMYRGGDVSVVARGTPVGDLGLTICYDLRFPAIFERLSEAGADVIAVPAAFTVPTGRAHWEVLLRARAIEAEVHIIAAAQHGKHHDGRETYGHSLAIDPWGEVLADAGEGVGLTYAEIDPERTADVRARIPVLSHRKPVPPPAD